MASQGPRFPTAAVNESVTPEDKDAWVNPTNVGADDASEATITAATFDSPDISQRLNTSGYGFTIPDGSTIDGIVVEIMRRNSAGAASDNRVQLRDASGTLVGDNKANTALDWPTTEALATYGGTTDTWNASPTVAMVNDPDFGVTLSVQADAANTDIQVDFIRITVHYTGPTTFPQAMAATAVGVATLVRTVTYSRTLAPVAVAVPTLKKGMFVTMASTSVGVAGMTKGMFRTMLAIAAGVPAIDVALLQQVNMPATAVGVPSLATAFVFVQNLTATAIGIATMVGQFIEGQIASVVYRLRHVRHHRRKR